MFSGSAGTSRPDYNSEVGPGTLVVNIIVNNCCMRKMLKHTEETIGFFGYIFVIGGISIGRGGGVRAPWTP